MWYFFQKTPGTKAREPMQGEFFSVGTIDSEAQALVREAVQNSLDARLEGGTTVRMRFYVSGTSGALSADRSGKYFDSEAWSHFQARKNGLSDVPEPGDPCAFVVIEDFETTGLFGDHKQWDFNPDTDEKNAFYFFFRAEGQSGKSDTDRGRWGIGKFVFPKSSRVRSFFGLTIREDGERLLAGQSVLRSHHVEGKPFTPDGWFGEIEEGEGHDLPVAILEAEQIDDFVADFCISRKTETGLSVVIPFVTKDFEGSALFRAVMKDYFFPILTGELEVEVASPDRAEVLDSSNILDQLEKNDGELADTLGLARLAKWGTGLDEAEFIELEAPDVDRKKPLWSKNMISDDLADRIREELANERPVAIRVPIAIRPKDTEPINTEFRIYLENADKSAVGTPLFIREGIVITDVRARKLGGTRALVVIDHKPLATLLGDAENPAHTQWQYDGGNFKGKYTNGADYLNFVRWSVSELGRIVFDAGKEKDESLLLDIFYLPETDEDAKNRKKPKTDKQKGDDPDKDPPVIEPKKKAYRLGRLDTGFRISGNPDVEDKPREIIIRVAYNRRRGSVFRKRKGLVPDFDLSDDATPLTIDMRNAKITESSENHIAIIVEGNDFELSVSGFDPNRDLVVDPRVREVPDA